jgi:hypothetical protein
MTVCAFVRPHHRAWHLGKLLRQAPRLFPREKRGYPIAPQKKWARALPVASLTMYSPVASTTVQGVGKPASIRAGSISAFYQSIVSIGIWRLEHVFALSPLPGFAWLCGTRRGILTAPGRGEWLAVGRGEWQAVQVAGAGD